MEPKPSTGKSGAAPEPAESFLEGVFLCESFALVMFLVTVFALYTWANVSLEAVAQGLERYGITAETIASAFMSMA